MDQVKHLNETTSLIIFKNQIENGKILDEDSTIEQLKRLVPKNVFELYKTAYYESAIKQVNVFQKQLVCLEHHFKFTVSLKYQSKFRGSQLQQLNNPHF